MLVTFHVNVIVCQIFNLPHIYVVFPRKLHFLYENSQIFQMVQSSRIMWFNKY
jgi:hypothetical protein